MFDIIMKFTRSLFYLFVFCFFIQPIFAASIRLETDSVHNAKKEYSIHIYVDTENMNTIGTDLLIQYNPSDDQYVKFEAGKLYPNYPEVKINTSKNEIRISGTGNYQNYINNNGLFGKVFFLKLNNTSKSSSRLVWVKGKTDETNVVSENGADLLDKEPLYSQKNTTSEPNEKKADTKDNSNQETNKENNSLIDSLIRNEINEKSKDKKEIIQTVPPLLPVQDKNNILGLSTNSILQKKGVQNTIFIVLILVGSTILGTLLFFFFTGKKRKDKETTSS